MHRRGCVAHISKAQLRIEIHVVVPGQPVGVVQLPIRQRHHLGEAGRQVIHLIDHPLRSNKWDGIRTGDLYRTVVYPSVAFSQTFSTAQRVLPFFRDADECFDTVHPAAAWRSW